MLSAPAATSRCGREYVLFQVSFHHLSWRALAAAAAAATAAPPAAATATATAAGAAAAAAAAAATKNEFFCDGCARTRLKLVSRDSRTLMTITTLATAATKRSATTATTVATRAIHVASEHFAREVHHKANLRQVRWSLCQRMPTYPCLSSGLCWQTAMRPFSLESRHAQLCGRT